MKRLPVIYFGSNRNIDPMINVNFRQSLEQTCLFKSQLDDAQVLSIREDYFDVVMAF